MRDGRHPVQFDPDERWSVRLSSDPYTDVWLISWTQEQSTELHDHAGSLGALTVVSGTVTERFWRPAAAGLSERRLRDGRGVGFPVGHVHDVVNTDPAPAVTVHTYSPPLTAMGYYEVDGAGALVVDRNVLEWRLDPTSPHRLEQADDPRRTVIVLCNEGYASSLAAVSLRDLGLVNATDLIGDFHAWAAAGLPVTGTAPTAP